jgi:hypothetical protein
MKKENRDMIQYKDSRMRGHATDAAAFDSISGGGMAFLSAELSIPHTKLVEPLEAHTHARDITIEFGGGFPEYISAWAENFMTSGGNEYGLSGTNNSDIPLVQWDLQQGNWVAWIWQAGMFVSELDLRKLQTAKRNQMAPPFSLEERLRTGVRLIWNKALDKVTYLGWRGQPGLINSTDVSSVSAAAVGTGGSTTWALKTGQQIFNDVQTMLYTAIANSGYSTTEGCPDSLLIPFTQHQLLAQPITINGTPISLSIQEYIEKYCLAAALGIKFKIFPLPNPWIYAQGASGTSRAIAYKNDSKDVLIKIPQEVTPLMTVPTMRRGGGYETGYAGCIGQVMWLRPQTALYMDGI